MPTVGQALQKMSELHSKIAVLQTLVVHVEINFVGGDMDPEHYIAREDGAYVPPEHIQTFLNETEAQILELREELSHWENLPLPAPKLDAGIQDQEHSRERGKTERSRRKKRQAVVAAKTTRKAATDE